MRSVWPGESAVARVHAVGRALVTLPCALALLFGGVPAAVAQESHEYAGEDELPSEQREELRLGFAQLETENVPGEFRYIARSLPLAMLNEFEGIPERVRTAGELDAVAERLLEDARGEASELIASLVDERDELLFESSDEQREAERARINEELAEAREHLRRLRATPSEAVVRQLDTRMPLRTVRNSDEQPLYAYDEKPGEDVDLLVGGRMRYEDEYLSIELSLLLRTVSDAAAGLTAGRNTRMAGEREDYVGRRRLASTIVRPADALNELDELRDDIISGILNRPFSRLQVDVEQPAASVSLDGGLAGFGTVSLPYLEPDEYELVVTAAGYEEEVREVELAESETVRMTVDLSPLPADRVTVNSEPEGANLYVGSEWIGRTPVTIDRPVGPRTAELRRDGFERARFVLEDRGPESLNRVLAPDSVDLTTELRDRREGFYRSLGWLAVSLPLPLILSGIWQNRADYFLDRQPNISTEEQQRFIAATSIVDGARWGGVALSGGLLINSIVQAVRYIRASRYYHFE